MREDNMKTYDLKASFVDEVTELERKNRILSRRIATEGIVLLENDGVLPLSANDNRIALYGNGARRTIYGGTGSGEVNSRELVSIEQGLINRGVEISTRSWIERYEEKWIRGKAKYIQEGRSKLKKLNSKVLADLIAAEYQYPDGDEITTEDISNSKTDTCIYVISRQSGEGRDRKPEKGDYRLTDIEIANIKKCAVCYSRFIVVINTGSSMDMNDIDNIDGINAVVYMSLLGMESGNALCDVLFGNETPSGHLAATWAKHYEDIPGADKFGDLAEDGLNSDYNEGLLVGYRYFDTKGIHPRYSFGYGLSYTSFESEVIDYKVAGDTLTLNIKVKNIGEKYSGKYVEGIYVGIDSHIDKSNDRPSKILVGFEKTVELKPQEETMLTIPILLYRLSIFDEKDSITKIPAGKYHIFHGIDISKCEYVGEFAIDSDIIKTHATKANQKDDDAKPIREILQKMSDKDFIELCVGNGLFSDGKGYQVPGSVGCTTTKFLNKGIRNILLCDGPAGIRLQKRSTISKNGKIKPIDYPLSLYELLPDFIVKSRLGNPDKEQVIYQFVTGFPVATAVAQTWNKEICFEMGHAVGCEMKKYGVTLWLAPAINIIRNPLCGRNYEYYSEDPVVSGEMAVCITKGVQQLEGCGVTIKHFACNNQETNRYYMSSNLSEKTLREIYLKAFQIVVCEAKPKALMTAYNKVNGIYSAENEYLLKNILRGEWGYQGLVMTDWLSVGEDRADEAKSIKAGVDLIMPGNKKNKKRLYKEYKSGLVERTDLLRAAENILRIIGGKTL